MKNSDSSPGILFYIIMDILKNINRLKLLAFVVAITVIASCSNEDTIETENYDYLIFGHFYGECIGEGCVETYKLTDTKLFEDSNDNYSGQEPFDFTELENNKFEEVKDIMDFFPSDLLSENENIIGCPDCADQGGLFIQYSKKGTVKSWRIDQSISQMPGYLHDFTDKVNEKIELINN